MASVFQFSIRSLLAAVTFLALGITALVNANGWWQAAMWGLVLFVLAAAILLIVYRREESRAFWLGFAVFGWLYLAVFFVSLLPAQTQFWIRTDPLRNEDLITTRIAQVAYSLLLPTSRTQAQIASPNVQPGDPLVAISQTYSGPMPGMSPGAGGPSMPGMAPGGMPAGPGGAGGMSGVIYLVANPNYVPIENFTHIAHALWLLLIAAIGGKTCQLIYRTRPKEE